MVIVRVGFVHDILGIALNPARQISTSSSIARAVLTDRGNLFGVDHLKALVLGLSPFRVFLGVLSVFVVTIKPYTCYW